MPTQSTTITPRAKRQPGVTIPCLTCGKQFHVKASWIRRRNVQFCSMDCRKSLYRNADYFWSCFEQRGECLEWTGSTDHGYGRIEMAGKSYMTHRLSWEYTNGPIPDGMDVCHTCDNPPCGRPSRLFLGSHTENMKDMLAKGRVARGLHNGKAKIADSDVVVIRLRYAEEITKASREEVLKIIGGDYGISPLTVKDIVYHKRRNHVEAGPKSDQLSASIISGLDSPTSPFGATPR